MTESENDRDLETLLNNYEEIITSNSYSDSIPIRLQLIKDDSVVQILDTFPMPLDLIELKDLEEIKSKKRLDQNMLQNIELKKLKVSIPSDIAESIKEEYLKTYFPSKLISTPIDPPLNSSQSSQSTQSTQSQTTPTKLLPKSSPITVTNKSPSPLLKNTKRIVINSSKLSTPKLILEELNPIINQSDPFLLDSCLPYLNELIKIKKIVNNNNNNNLSNSKFICYWCQNSPRIVNNPALYYSIYLSMKVKLPLLVFTCISPSQINKSNYYRSNAFQLFSDELKIYNIPLLGLYMEEKDLSSFFGQFTRKTNPFAIITDESLLPSSRKYSLVCSRTSACSFFSFDCNSIYQKYEDIPLKLIELIERNEKLDVNDENYIHFFEHIVSYPKQLITPISSKWILPLSLQSHLYLTDTIEKTWIVELPEVIVNKWSRVNWDNVNIKYNNVIVNNNIDNNKIKTIDDFYNEYGNNNNNNNNNVINNPLLKYGLLNQCYSGRISPMMIFKKFIENNNIIIPNEIFYVYFINLEVSLYKLYERHKDLSYPIIISKYIPNWVIETLEDHSTDKRTNRNYPADFETAITDDQLFNIIQKYLVKNGIIPFELIDYWIHFPIYNTQPPLIPVDLSISLLNKYFCNGYESVLFHILNSYNDNNQQLSSDKLVTGKMNVIDLDVLNKKIDVKSFINNM